MFDKELLEVGLGLLQMCGLNPIKRNRIVLINLCIGTVLTATHFALLLFEFVYRWNGVETLEFLGEFLVGYCQAIPKLLTIIHNEDKFVKLISKVYQFDNHKRVNSSLEAKLNGIFKQFKMAITFYMFSASVAVFLTFGRPLVMNLRVLPVPLHVFFDATKSPFYEIFYVVETVEYVFIVFIIAGSDILFFSLISFVYYELVIVTNKFESFVISDDCVKQFGDIVEHHDSIMSCICDLNSIYSTFFLNQFFCSMCGSCMSILILTSNNLLVGNAIFHASWWIEAPTSLKQNIAMVIQRAQRNASISVGEILNLDLELCTTVLQASLSFLNTILALKK
ncbi:hypothetical protein FQR65_LT11334 [Abscondita terminalis]|nr:hypothetical protein FQR65_LT11334 [Abscondita terminalis]